MLRTLPGRLAMVVGVMGVCTVVSWMAGVKAQPGKGPLCPGFLPYVPPGEWRPAGIQGNQGVQGVQGNQGFQGNRGIQGNQGIQGFQNFGNRGGFQIGGGLGGFQSGADLEVLPASAVGLADLTASAEDSVAWVEVF